MINERATPTLGMSHALIAPTAIVVTYIVVTIFIIGSLKQQYPSWFLHVYTLVSCCIVQTTLSFTVFKALRTSQIANKHPALALNGVLPMINTVLLIVDLTVVTLSSRSEIMPSPSLQSTGPMTHIELQRHS
ncbi:unnamed protein product [Pieris brassicae]|uniref:Uncharacterized protein n=1 Tax=Pieris brassicae TaxID=7116 RepID=A0A9P0TY27_PIEBR|nr:unnamed protein product [Pieris brassicae]